jgi:hypothetical protein
MLVMIMIIIITVNKMGKRFGFGGAEPESSRDLSYS